MTSVIQWAHGRVLCSFAHMRRGWVVPRLERTHRWSQGSTLWTRWSHGLGVKWLHVMNLMILRFWLECSLWNGRFLRTCLSGIKWLMSLMSLLSGRMIGITDHDTEVRSQPVEKDLGQLRRHMLHLCIIVVTGVFTNLAWRRRLRAWRLKLNQWNANSCFRYHRQDRRRANRKTRLTTSG